MGENVWSIPILASQPNLLWVTLVKTPHRGAGQTAVDGNQSGGKFADDPLFQITVFNWIIAVFDWIIGGCGSLFAGDLDGRDYLRKRMLPSAQICGRKIWAIQRNIDSWRYDIFDSVVSSALGTGCRFDQGGRETKQDVTPTKHTQEPIIMLYNILKKNAFSSIFMVIWQPFEFFWMWCGRVSLERKEGN